MTKLQLLNRKVIELHFSFLVRLVSKAGAMRPLKNQQKELRLLPQGTVGRDLVDCLDRQQLNLVPYFASHDLKHVLLDYDMTPEGEIRLLAFEVGNRNYSPVTLALFLFGWSLLPDRWSLLYQDFKRGRKSVCISKWTIAKYAKKKTAELKRLFPRLPQLSA